MIDGEQKEAFVFYETFIDSIKELEPEDQYRFLCAIVNYGIYGIEEAFSGMEKALWLQMKNAIDRSKERRRTYQENGAKGGRPKRPVSQEEREEKPEKTEENQSESKENQKGFNCFLSENLKKPNETKENQSETKKNLKKPNETKENQSETKKNLNGNGNGNGEVNGNGDGNEKGNGNGAAAAVKHEEFLKNYESPPDIPAQQQQQQQQQQGFEFHDFSPGEIYSLFRDIDGKLYFDRDYYAQVALFFNTEARTDYETARRYVRELVGAAGKYDNPAGYLYRVVTKPDVWRRFSAKAAGEPVRTADGWICPVCGKKYLAGSVCADCGLTANSDEQDVEVARKRRELTGEEFDEWQRRRSEERAEAARKIREEILGGVF